MDVWLTLQRMGENEQSWVFCSFHGGADAPSCAERARDGTTCSQFHLTLEEVCVQWMERILSRSQRARTEVLQGTAIEEMQRLNATGPGSSNRKRGEAMASVGCQAAV